MLFGRHPEAPAPRFRILIIGNANAGKTTILKNVCCGNSEVELEPSIRRGEHDIETEIMYPTDFGFVFHDSMGFEAGTATELKEVERFLASRAQKEQLKDRVHAIWYCLSTSGDRSMTEAEMSFFHMNTGDVPIIVIFTKVDTLERKAFNKLLRQGVPFSDAKREAPAEAEAAFQRDYFKQLEHYLQGNERTSAPVRIMQLRDMNKDGADTKELLACTAASLDRDALRLLMYSVLRNDVRRRVETSITSIVIYDARVAMEKNAFTEQQQLYLLSSILLLFPHILPQFEDELDEMSKNANKAAQSTSSMAKGQLPVSDFTRVLDFNIDNFSLALVDKLVKPGDEFLPELFPYLPKILGNVHPHCQVIKLGTAVLSILQYSLFADFIDFPTAVTAFMKSDWSDPMMDTITEAFNEASSVTEMDSGRITEILDANRLLMIQFLESTTATNTPPVTEC